MSPTLRRRRENGQAKLVLVDRLRTGEGEDDAPGLDFSERNGVESRVTLEGVAQRILVLGESRGIQHNQIVVAARAIEKFECIFGVGFVPLVVRKIERDVGLRESDGLFAGIHAVHAFSPAPHRIDRETAGVTEHVQDRTPAAVLFEQASVVSLVHEKSRFLAFEPVNVEFQTILKGDILFCVATQEAIFLLEISFVGECRLTLVVDVAHRSVGCFEQRVGNGLAVAVHPHRVGLHHRRFAKNVDDQTG